MSPAVKDERIAQLKACIAENDPGRRYFVDFDFTLLLANSTDLYINSAEPRAVYWPLMKGLGALRPWAFRGGNSVLLHRDPTRLAVLSRLRPGLFEAFQRRQDNLFEQKKNTELTDLLSSVDPANIIIVSFGLAAVIENLLKGSRFAQSQVIATRLETMSAERAAGKLAMLRAADRLPTPSRDVVITDSRSDDGDLLDYVDQGFHIQWI